MTKAPNGTSGQDFARNSASISVARRHRRLRAMARHGNRRRGDRESRRLGRCFSFRQRHGESAVEGIACRRGVDHCRPCAPESIPASSVSQQHRAVAAQLQHHAARSQRLQLPRHVGGIAQALHAQKHAGFAFVGRQPVHILEQLRRQRARRRGIENESPRPAARASFAALMTPSSGVSNCASTKRMPREGAFVDDIRGDGVIGAGRHHDHVVAAARHDDARRRRRLRLRPEGACPRHCPADPGAAARRKCRCRCGPGTPLCRRPAPPPRPGCRPCRPRNSERRRPAAFRPARASGRQTPPDPYWRCR